MKVNFALLQANPPVRGAFALQVSINLSPIERILELRSTADVGTLRAECFSIIFDLAEKYPEENNLVVSVDNELDLLIATSLVHSWATANWKDSSGNDVSDCRKWEEVYGKWNAVKLKGKQISFTYEPKDPERVTFAQAALAAATEAWNPSVYPKWKVTGSKKTEEHTELYKTYNRDNGKPITGKELKGPLRVCQLIVESYAEGNKSNMDFFSLEAAHELAKAELIRAT